MNNFISISSYIMTVCKDMTVDFYLNNDIKILV